MRWLLCILVSCCLGGVSQAGDVEFAGKKASEWFMILKDHKKFDMKARQGALIAMEVVGARIPGVAESVMGAMADDPEAEIRREAASLLGRMTGDLTKDAGKTQAQAFANALAERMAKEKDGEVRRTVAAALGGRMTEVARNEVLVRQMLAKALRDEHLPTRTAAAETLKNYREAARSAFAELLALAADSKSEDIGRRFAIQALSRFKDLSSAEAGDIVKAFSTFIKDEEAPFGVRESALEALGFMKTELAIPGLVDGLKSEDAELRRMAIRGFAPLKDKAKAAWPHIDKAVDDKDSFVRHQAIVLCGILGTVEPVAVKRLANAADKDRTIENRLTAIQALGDLGPVAEPALKTLDNLATSDARATIRDAAKKAAKRIRGA